MSIRSALKPVLILEQNGSQIAVHFFFPIWSALSVLTIHRYKSTLLKILSVGISTTDIVLECLKMKIPTDKIADRPKCNVHYRTHFLTLKITYDKVRGLCIHEKRQRTFWCAAICWDIFDNRSDIPICCEIVLITSRTDRCTCVSPFCRPIWRDKGRDLQIKSQITTKEGNLRSVLFHISTGFSCLKNWVCQSSFETEPGSVFPDRNPWIPS